MDTQGVGKRPVCAAVAEPVRAEGVAEGCTRGGGRGVHVLLLSCSQSVTIIDRFYTICTKREKKTFVRSVCGKPTKGAPRTAANQRSPQKATQRMPHRMAKKFLVSREKVMESDR